MYHEPTAAPISTRIKIGMKTAAVLFPPAHCVCPKNFSQFLHFPCKIRRSDRCRLLAKLSVVQQLKINQIRNFQTLLTWLETHQHRKQPQPYFDERVERSCRDRHIDVHLEPADTDASTLFWSRDFLAKCCSDLRDKLECLMDLRSHVGWQLAHLARTCPVWLDPRCLSSPNRDLIRRRQVKWDGEGSRHAKLFSWDFYRVSPTR